MKQPRIADVVDVNLADPSTFRDGPPHEAFARLRREAPVAWHEHVTSDGPGFWVVTRYEDVMRASRDHQTFSSDSRLGGTLIEPAGDDAELHMMNSDPPDHTRRRAHVRYAFTPSHIRTTHEHVRRLIKDVVSATAGLESCDLVPQVTAKIPPLALAELLGVPLSDRPKFAAWVDALLDVEPIERSRSPSCEAAELFSYVHELAGRSGSAVLDALLTREVDGRRADPVELYMFFMFLAIAGNSTVRAASTGGALALLEHRDQLERLRKDRSLLPTAVEEVLRYVSPVNYFRRTAVRDTLLSGATIRAGDKVTLWYSSANRDEKHFPDPDRFDVTRSPNEHIAFGGHGPHFCLGAGFARFQLTETLTELVDHLLPHLTLAGPVQRPRQNHENEISSLPVRRK